MNSDDFESCLTVILRDAGPGVISELTDTVFAYLGGGRLVYARIDPAGTTPRTAEVDLVSGHWPEWQDWLADWLTDPVLSVRHGFADDW